MTSSGKQPETAANAAATADAPTQQEVVNQFKNMRMELQRLAGKVGDLEGERDEHRYGSRWWWWWWSSWWWWWWCD